MAKKTTKRPVKAVVTWFGHSAFLIESPSGRRLLVDPWLTNPKAPAKADEIDRIDTILLTHGHADHLGNTRAVAARTGASILAGFELSEYLKSLGLKATGFSIGGTVELEGISVTMVRADHSAEIEVDETFLPGGTAAGYIIRLENGFSLYHAGDTGLFGDMKLIGSLYRPDVAILPIGDHYTMGPRDAAVACTLLRSRYFIGMHFGTYPILRGTPEELRRRLPAAMRKRVIALTPGAPVSLV